MAPSVGAGRYVGITVDFVLAGDKFPILLQAFSNIGIVPDTGGTYFLPKVLGSNWQIISFHR